MSSGRDLLSIPPVGTSVKWNRPFGSPETGEVVPNSEWEHQNELEDDSFVVDYGDRRVHHRLEWDTFDSEDGTLVIGGNER